jgi:hypothetical protein
MLIDTCPGCRTVITATFTRPEHRRDAKKRLQRKAKVHAETCEKFQAVKRAFQ